MIINSITIQKLNSSSRENCETTHTHHTTNK